MKYIHKLRKEVIEHKKAANKNERFSRRSNIRLVCISEAVANQKDDCIGIVEGLAASLQSPLRYERAHHYRMKRTCKPRHVLVKLLSYRDKVDIMSRAPRVLQGEEYYITDDQIKVTY